MYESNLNAYEVYKRILNPGGGGRGTPLYGLYRYGYGFSAVLVINRVSILAILIVNRIWFCTLVLSAGYIFSYLFIIIDKIISQSPS